MLTEGLRITSVLFGAWLAVWFVVIGVVLRNTRQWGCYMGALFCGAVALGNAEHIHLPPSVPTILNLCGIACGFIYVAKVRFDPGWRSKGKP